jgi:isoaspartyl peptidase/L-asparaginase-like protein (Ntn-hydrolase superfamily)
VIDRFAPGTGDTAGVIAINHGGSIGHAHNATDMSVAVAET